MVYTVEPHSAEALAVLQNLASLNLLTLKPLNGNTSPSTSLNAIPPISSRRGKRVRRLSPETTQKWLEHLQTVRSEWDRI